MAGGAPTKVVGRRTAAFLLDWLIISVIGSALFFLFAEKKDTYASNHLKFTSGGDTWVIDGGRLWIYTLLNLAILIAIAVVWEGRSGKTPGKAMLGLRVVRPDGSPPGYGRAALRLIAWVVDLFPWFLLTGLTGFITAMASKGNRRVGDMMAGTYVVRAQDAGVPVTFPEPSPGLATVATPAPGRDAFGNPVPVAGPPVSAPYGTAAAQTQPAAPPPSAAADWYPDPTGEKRLRYWDGAAWTAHVAD